MTSALKTLRPELTGEPSLDAPLVSIVIPHRNHHRWLRACLASCLAQTHPRLEILVVDDASTVDVAPIVLDADRSARPGHRVHLYRAASWQGPGHARNLGLGHASGTVVQFLDADDYITPDKIATQLAAMAASGADAVLSRWRYVVTVGPVTIPVPVEPRLPTEELMLRTVADGEDWFPVMACLFKRSLLDRVGPWDERDGNEDRNYRYRILRENSAWTQVDACTFSYRRYIGASRWTSIELSQSAADDRRQSDVDFLKQVRKDFAARRLDPSAATAIDRLAARLQAQSTRARGGHLVAGRGPLHTWVKTRFRQVTSDGTRFQLTMARSLLKFLVTKWTAALRRRAAGRSPST